MADEGEGFNRRAAIFQAWVRLEEHEAAHPGQPYATVLHLRKSRPRTDIAALAQEISETAGSPVTPEAFRKLLQRARAKFLQVLIELGYRGQ
jgi:hypothetical protein